MWTSNRGRKRSVEECAADLGEVTLDEEPGGVYLEGERRWTQVYSPGGYSWRPGVGDQVLVLKAGCEKEEPCIVGRKQEDVLKPGEVRIQSGNGKAQVRLGGVNEVQLVGTVVVNGEALEKMIERIVRELG